MGTRRGGRDVVDDVTRRARIDVLLAEFDALRKEIADRSTAQHALMTTLNLTAIVALVSVVATGRVDGRVLLLICPVSWALGLLWADHGRTIRDLGTYIDEELRTSLREITGEALLAWEEKSQDYQRDRNVLLDYRLPLFLIFGGPPIAAIVVTAVYEPGMGQFDTALFVYWTGGCLLTTYLLAVLGRMQFAAHQKPPSG